LTSPAASKVKADASGAARNEACCRGILRPPFRESARDFRFAAEFPAGGALPADLRQSNVQPSLFATSGIDVLADDHRGRITYPPSFIDAATAGEWFATLRASVPWRAVRRQMYTRDVDVPRLIASFRLDPASPDIPAVILDAAGRVTSHLAVPFNSVGLNCYRDGRDSVAPHNDHLYELREGYPIALVSLGATRRMALRAKTPPRRAWHVDLEAGSLFVMDYATQVHYIHAVPKTTDAVGERISLAFRVKPQR
jgi:alkylated DNA repair dioxygenase AlkB